MSSPTLLAGQKPNTARASSSSSRTIRLEQRPGVEVQARRRRSHLRVGEDGGEVTREFPRLEERSPVDPVHQLGERILLERADAGEAWAGAG